MWFLCAAVVCVCACVRACVCACVRACVRACMHVFHMYAWYIMSVWFLCILTYEWVSWPAQWIFHYMYVYKCYICMYNINVIFIVFLSFTYSTKIRESQSTVFYGMENDQGMENQNHLCHGKSRHGILPLDMVFCLEWVSWCAGEFFIICMYEIRTDKTSSSKQGTNNVRGKDSVDVAEDLRGLRHTLIDFWIVHLNRSFFFCSKFYSLLKSALTDKTSSSKQGINNVRSEDSLNVAEDLRGLHHVFGAAITRIKLAVAVLGAGEGPHRHGARAGSSN